MTEPPIDLPAGRLNCFVVGARPADAVYPGRLDRRDYTLQVLTFEGEPAEQTFRGVIHLNVPTGPFTKIADGRNDGADDLAFARLLVERCRTTTPREGVFEEVEGLPGRYLRRQALSRAAFTAIFEEVVGSYGRDVPIESSVAPYGKVDWPTVIDAAKAHGRVRSGGANLGEMNCLAGDSMTSWVNRFEDGPRTVSVNSLLRIAIDRPVLIVDGQRGQLAAVPSDSGAVNLFRADQGGRPDGIEPLAGRLAVYGTPWLSTLLAMMLNKRRHLDAEWCTLETATVPIDEEQLKGRIKRIRKELGRFHEMFIPYGKAGRGRRSRGKLSDQAMFVVVYDEVLQTLLEREESAEAWRKNEPPPE